MIAIKLFLSLLLVSLLGALAFLSSETDEFVMIESVESKTLEGKPVFNKIGFESFKDKDVWTMFQSHNGKHAKEWDKIQIVIDKTVKPFKASFFQYKDGKEAEYRASCLMCHSNGPRLIRPVWKKLKWSEKLQVAKWNFKIKMYGLIQNEKERPLHGVKRVVPLGFQNKISLDELNLASCNGCHNGGKSILGRAKLQRQQAMTIDHLVNVKAMPPWPYKITESDEKKLEMFLQGF